MGVTPFVSFRRVYAKEAYPTGGAFEGISNAVNVFAALACENPFPCQHMADLSLNQMVLKAVFVELAKFFAGLSIFIVGTFATAVRAVSSGLFYLPVLPGFEAIFTDPVIEPRFP